MAASFLTSKLALAAFGKRGAQLRRHLFGGQAPGKFDYRLTIKPTVTTAYKAYGNREAAGRQVLDGLHGHGQQRGVRAERRDRLLPHPGLRRLDHSPDDPRRASRPDPRAADLPQTARQGHQYPAPAHWSLEVKLAWNDGEKDHEKIEVREFDFRGVNEIEYTSLPSDEVLSWYDVYDNAEICAAFVTYEDPVVRQYLGEVSETMGGFPICSNAEELIKAMRSIYDYQVATGMKYAGNTGVPENLGEASSYVQNIRLPRDVVYQNSGLCIELAMLWAALGQGASAKAHLALILVTASRSRPPTAASSPSKPPASAVRTWAAR
ncbi:MAG: hypothetical protein R3F17_03035 [Planctomycetota bacterium]